LNLLDARNKRISVSAAVPRGLAACRCGEAVLDQSEERCSLSANWPAVLLHSLEAELDQAGRLSCARKPAQQVAACDREYPNLLRAGLLLEYAEDRACSNQRLCQARYATCSYSMNPLAGRRPSCCSITIIGKERGRQVF